MHALEFLLNGKRLCIASPGNDGIVVSNVVLTDTASVHFRVGGSQQEQHLEWVHGRMALGDKMEIRVIDTPQSDAPGSIKPVTDADRERLRIASLKATNPDIGDPPKESHDRT